MRDSVSKCILNPWLNAKETMAYAIASSKSTGL